MTITTATRPPLTLSVPEAGRLAFGIGPEAAYRAAHADQIPVLRVGRSLRVPTAKLAELVGVTVEDLFRAAADEAEVA